MPILKFVCTLYNITNMNTQRLDAKIPSRTCLHNLYTKNIINTKARCKNTQSYMCTYPIQQQKQKHKGLFPKFPFLHVYIPYTITQT